MVHINPKTQDAYDLLHQGVQALARAEQQGIRIDMDYLLRQIEIIDGRIKQLENRFFKTKFYKHWEHVSRGKINIYSGQQLGHFLYKVKKLEPPAVTSKSGQGKTDEEALKSLGLPELDLYLKIKKWKKTQDVLKNFEREQVNGILHPVFNLHLVITYRSSSDSPNFQNIPNRDETMKRIIRRALYPRQGHLLLEVDYGSLEVRVGACYHQDENMIRYIKDKSTDMHRDVAMEIYRLDEFDKSIPGYSTLRSAAKNGFVFPQFYGSYYKNCAESLACRWCDLPKGKWRPGQGLKLGNEYLSDHLIRKGLRSYNKFTDSLKSIEDSFWKQRFKKYDWWRKVNWELYQKYGYVDYKTGFRISGEMEFKEINNYPIQGSAFHCLLWSFVELDRIMRKERWKSRLIGQIHDSIIIDVNPDELNRVMRVVQRVTCEDLPKAWKWIIVPLEIEAELSTVDGNWAEKEVVKFEDY